VTATSRPVVRQALKRGLDWCSLVLVAPCAWACRVEASRGDHRDAIFSFWAQTFALVPGLPGVFVRRAFYRLTLDRCTGNFFIGFGALFSHRQSTVEDAVYVGPYAIIGSSRLRRGCLIGSRAGILSGGDLHQLDAKGRWSPSDLSRLRQVEIGEYAWIGEASIVMADVGRSAMVTAGAVVSSRVPPGIVVGGNPARFVRNLAPVAAEERTPASAAV
jgi:virginiamycin A acetyltransferase